MSNDKNVINKMTEPTISTLVASFLAETLTDYGNKNDTNHINVFLNDVNCIKNSLGNDENLINNLLY